MYQVDILYTETLASSLFVEQKYRSTICTGEGGHELEPRPRHQMPVPEDLLDLGTEAAYCLIWGPGFPHPELLLSDFLLKMLG